MNQIAHTPQPPGRMSPGEDIGHRALARMGREQHGYRDSWSERSCEANHFPQNNRRLVQNDVALSAASMIAMHQPGVVLTQYNIVEVIPGLTLETTDAVQQG